ncbi:hypothetical protein BP6252_13126 [Coleophoma cylindrospora]|uniref:Nucleoside phosphorylase domain-containing protein n=1 Tax=Coleophoma cylindrospora TaxID=1849047 RepID=A0A3D8QAF1_9HELO|nr:hypothetical protein BP6252_13126 [Coleophoma cylindrospora]
MSRRTESSTFNHSDYTVGWICALQKELTAARCMLDELHDEGNPLPQAEADKNIYLRGRIHGHNVVIARSGAGTTSATVAAIHMLHTYPNIRFGLLVGIAGGAPRGKDNDIRLGDIVISMPTKDHGGVVQVDFGTQVGEGFAGFKITGQLNKPPRLLINAVEGLKSRHDFEEPKLQEYISPKILKEKYSWLPTNYYSNSWDDILFKADYLHQDGLDRTCAKCEKNQAEHRVDRAIQGSNGIVDKSPKLHYGIIASANQTMRYAKARDEYAKAYGVLCFEKEAAGLADDFPCIVIRGICNYADSHENIEWQEYAALVAAAYGKELLSVIPESSVKETKTFKPILHYIPFQKNHHFFGRDSYLKELQSKLWLSNKPLNYCPQAAICGLGGMGKTALAIEFAYQTKKQQPQRSIFWVAAINREAFEQSYKEIGKCLGIPGIEDEKSDVKKLVQAELSKEGFGEWLLIVDNADDANLLSKTKDERTGARPFFDYLPASMKGSILFTTRNRKAVSDRVRGDIIDVAEPTPAEAQHILGNYLSQKDLLKDEANVMKLLELLSYLPLAIVQAAAYLESNKDTSIAAYITQIKGTDDELIELLSEDFDDQSRYQKNKEMKNPVATTWLISLEHIGQHDALAIDYLSFMACLLRERIPRSLLLEKSSEVKNTNMKALGTLTAYTFISRRKKEKDQELNQKEEDQDQFYDMHRLVHVVTRNWLKKQGNLSNWTDRALHRLMSLIPYGGHEGWENWIPYLPHALQIARSNDLSADCNQEIHILLDMIARCQSSIGQYTAAVETHRRVLELRTEAMGTEHEDTMISGNEIGLNLSYQGQYTEAERIHREMFALREKVSGKEHPLTLVSMNNLGLAFSCQGKYAEAESIHRETLALREKVLGKEHTETLTSMMWVATTLGNLGNYSGSQDMYLSILETQKKLLGKEHPLTLASMNNLGQALSNQGKYTEAEIIHRETLALREKVLGKKHPETLTSMMWVATTLGNLGNYSRSKDMYLNILEDQKRVLGKEHPLTLASMNNLGQALSNQGNYAEANSMHRETLALREKVLGKEHPETLTSMMWVATTLGNLGNYSGSQDMYLNILKNQKRVLGNENPSMLTSMNEVEVGLGRQGKCAEAESMYRETFSLRGKASGKEHPETLMSMNNLGQALSDQGRYAEAESIHRETLTLRQRVLGKDSPLTMTRIGNPAWVPRKQDRQSMAQQVLNQVGTVDGEHRLNQAYENIIVPSSGSDIIVPQSTKMAIRDSPHINNLPRIDSPGAQAASSNERKLRNSNENNPGTNNLDPLPLRRSKKKREYKIGNYIKNALRLD